MGQDLVTCPPDRGATRANAIQIRRFASQTKPIQDCHPERSEGSLTAQRSFAPLRMTKRDGLFFEMDWPQGLLYLSPRQDATFHSSIQHGQTTSLSPARIVFIDEGSHQIL